MQASASNTSNITVKEEGEANTTSYRMFFERDGTRISPFHDIPLYADEEKQIFNMVVEIPRNTRAKMEISKEEAWNPIKQDVKNGKLREVTYGDGYMWNYGAFPQTWEDANYKHPDTDALGDKDPLDVCEIGSAVATRGQIKQVKVLGVMALIDEGETDWKIIAIDVNDELADKLNDIEDIERELPSLLHDTYVWFRDYKKPDGKPENSFAFEGKAKNREYALHIIKENSEFWQNLISGKTPNHTDKYSIACDNVLPK
ncbi:Inorganic pyrophosphatase [Balamuthia mandrillaris]